jgi:hypothetical protein
MKAFVNPIVYNYWLNMQNVVMNSLPALVRLTGDGQVWLTYFQCCWSLSGARCFYDKPKK